MQKGPEAVAKWKEDLLNEQVGLQAKAIVDQPHKKVIATMDNIRRTSIKLVSASQSIYFVTQRLKMEAASAGGLQVLQVVLATDRHAYPCRENSYILASSQPLANIFTDSNFAGPEGARGFMYRLMDAFELVISFPAEGNTHSLAYIYTAINSELPILICCRSGIQFRPL
jgi:hypothetical protein